ncbi:glycoside hydrolase family 5 protein [Coniochaeta ligniaria NRRL 30616]|uniref:Glycoside hydrolase family 5 protein n=1 Tax=Coniochaeta ligniaria NRRL 30616 TaxID=1408157 RepID=A0A1J7J0Z3_9PEZI|nr:glycoside hydrolase family 5 protein [Coniochaeta ligniaria NRRL 30616]
MTILSRLLLILGSLLPLVQSQALPLHTSSRWILDANNTRVKLRCINWAGHMETHVPEGLHKQSIDFLADWIAQQGFNCVRLTYSIDHALNPDLKVCDAFAAAAAASGASRDALVGLYNQAVAKNPFLATATTRDVYGAVVDALWSRGVMTLLDNHVSRASWCCNLTDGNGWWDSAFGYNKWNSRFFHTQDWLSGLQAMAGWATSHGGVVAMSLRNEMREFLLQGLDGRQDWYDLVGRAGRAVHAANPDVLVVVGGTQSSTDLTHVRGRMLDTSGWPGKHVWEMHAYSFTVTFPNLLGSCDSVKLEYGAFAGFVLEQGEAYTAPLILSEFGVGMTGGSAGNQGLSDQDRNYLSCLAGYMEGNDAEWAVWALQGSYYVRDGTVDYDEGWGVLDHDWSGWRNPEFPSMLGAMWKVTQGP